MVSAFTTQLDELLDQVCESLQLSVSQRQAAESHYVAIGNWLDSRESGVAIYGPTIYPQGSLRIGTTVRPLRSGEYDLDLVLELSLDWERLQDPVALLDAVEARLRQHGTYSAMLERKNRCIRVNYANEFHLDILPACRDPFTGPGCVVVPDREARAWKPSCPKGYAEWFEARAGLFKHRVEMRVEPLPAAQPFGQVPPLKRAVQLIKRWRDVRYSRTVEVAPISIVLTTLAARHYDGNQSVYHSVERVLSGVVGSLPRSGRLMVPNPTNPHEDFSERWDETPHAYDAFVQGINALKQQWLGLGTLVGIDEIGGALTELFGEQPVTRAIATRAALIEQHRHSGRLQMQSSSGLLIGPAAAGGIPVRRNTFHGN